MFKFKHIYFTLIEKQFLTTYTNLFWICFLVITPVLAPNVWDNEKSQSWDMLPWLKLGTSWLQGRRSTSWPRLFTRTDKVLGNTGEKDTNGLIATSIFSFSHNVVYLSKTNFNFEEHLYGPL